MCLRSYLIAWGCVAALALGCSVDGEDRVLGINATGAVIGRVFLDGNGDRQFDTGDAGIDRIAVHLLASGTRDTVGQGATGTTGVFVVDNLPVGSYTVAVDAPALGDSLDLEGTGSVEVDVQADDTVAVAIAVSYLSLARITDALAVPTGQKVFLEGIALNSQGTFGDSTVHLSDDSGAILATRVETEAVTRGDSVRFLGTIDVRDGQMVLRQVTSFLLNEVDVPSPESVSAAVAAAADGGRLNAGLVRIADVSVTDTVTVGEDLVLTAEDGSGSLEILLDRDAPISRSSYGPGTVLHATGLLIPATGGDETWRLRPRSDEDLDVTVGVVTLRAVRSLSLGDEVLVTAVAMNTWDAFGDLTVHVADTSGAIRVSGTAASGISMGDSVRMLAAVDALDGQRILESLSVTMLATVTPPSPTAVATGVAASAAGGSLDGALVAMESVVIVDTSTVGADVVLTVSDGSGAVEVVLDADVAIDPAPYDPPGVIDVEGLLVPSGPGTWQVKPRRTADIDVVIPVVTVAQARAMPLGEQVVVIGITLNDLAAFGDGSVHLADGTGALRVTNVVASLLFAGDSVQFRGILSTHNGQRILDFVAASRITNVGGTPPPVVVSTDLAASANGGALDAALVRVTGAQITAVTTVGADVVLTVDDGSGPLEVVLDDDTGIVTAPFVVSENIDAIGLLLPTVTGTWQLKPRSNFDIAVLP